MNSATQYKMRQEVGGKWVAECLNTRLSLPILLHVEYSVKLEKMMKHINEVKHLELL